MEKLIETYLKVFDRLDFEKIIDHPNILIAANFWDSDRFEAAKTCYQLMRAIDDMIDNYKSINCEIAKEDRSHFEQEVRLWINSVTKDGTSDLQNKKTSAILERFKIPIWTLEVFARSMIYDIYHDGFASLEIFLEYCSGASIAPASVFVHLCGITPMPSGEYKDPVFDVRKAATPCAVFSYIVHIIRDFQKDQHNNLTYFADDQIEKYGLDRSQLKAMGNGEKISTGFREMIRTYYNLANEYRFKTLQMIGEIKPLVAPCYQLSLEIIFELYLMVFERINPDQGIFTTIELNPTPREIRNRVYQTIMNFKPVA